MKRRYWFYLAVIVAVAIGIWYATREDPVEVVVSAVERGVVFACPAHECFAGHDAAPAERAIEAKILGWRALSF